MSRNSTHLSKIARLISSISEITYAQALMLARNASDAGTLCLPLNNHGINGSAAKIIAQYRNPRISPAEQTTFAYGAQDEAIILDAKTLRSHMLVLGETGTGRSVATPPILDALLNDGQHGIYFDAYNDCSPGGYKEQAQICAKRAASDFTTHAADTNTPGLPFTWGQPKLTGLNYIAPSGIVAGEVLNHSVDNFLQGVLDLIESRGAEEKPEPMFVLIDDAGCGDVRLLANILRTARKANLSIIVNSVLWAPESEAISPNWQAVLSNANTKMVLRHSASNAKAFIAEFMDREDRENMGDQIAEMTIGQGLLQTDIQNPRLVKLAMK